MGIMQDIRRLWEGRCTVYIQKPQENADGITGFREQVVLEDEPCRISFASSPPASGAPAATAAQSVKLFLRPDADIPPGSKITVTQNGHTQDYAQSGTAARYTYHQEIALELWEDWV